MLADEKSYGTRRPGAVEVAMIGLHRILFDVNWVSACIDIKWLIS